MTRLVVIESPYAGDVAGNVAYARRALADSLARGEAPLASHLLYTQPGVLNDDRPDERKQGIEAGLAWATRADLTVFYIDRGWSPGMVAARERCEAEGRRYTVRRFDRIPGKTMAESLGLDIPESAPGGSSRAVHDQRITATQRTTGGMYLAAEADYEGWGRDR